MKSNENPKSKVKAESNDQLPVNPENTETLEIENDISIPDKLSEEIPTPVEEIVLTTPLTEEAVVDAPLTEDVVADAPLTEEVVADAPITEEIVADAPIKEEVAVDAPLTEEVAVDAPLTEEVAVDAPLAEEVVAEEITIEEPVAAEDLPEVPPVEEAEPEAVVTEELTPEIPAIEMSVPEQVNTVSETTEVAQPEETLPEALSPANEVIEELGVIVEKADQAEHLLTHGILEDYESCSRGELVDKLEKLVNEEDLNSIKTQVALIKVTFLKSGKLVKQEKLDQFLEGGGVREEYIPAEDPLDVRFTEVFNIYKSRKHKFNEEQEQEKLRNLEAKKQILDELKVLINSEETLKKTYDEFKVLQEKWKQIGMVPKAEANTLWQNYHFLVEKFFDKVKINNELKDLDLKKNLEAKMAICEKSEALLLETSVLKSFKQLQQYHEEWKEIGPVPQDKKDEIWNRFKDATDKINERRREYYDQVQEEQESNLMAKNALIDQAEKVLGVEVTTNKLWQETTDQMNELQKIWRTIGPAPKAKNDEVWHRFKTLVDTYFSNKKDFFNDIKEEQVHNYNVKLDLCAQAEAIKDSTDWKKTTQEFIKLQEEWKKAGPVPRKYSDRLWKRFRSACDEFFSNKSRFFSTIQASEQDNLQKKEELIKKVQEYLFTEDKKQNLEIINGFQREWMEIGFVPIKEKERLQHEFRKTINEQLDKLKISATEMSTAAFRNRYETIRKESPDAIRIIGRERTTLAQKISELQEEIKLWENNIGFLAASKKANLLKEEFEIKINKAKEELKLLEVKFKLLRES